MGLGKPIIIGIGVGCGVAVALIIVLAAALAPRPIPCTQPTISPIQSTLCESGANTVATTITLTGENFFNLDGQLPTFQLNGVGATLVSLNDCSGTYPF